MRFGGLNFSIFLSKILSNKISILAVSIILFAVQFLFYLKLGPFWSIDTDTYYKWSKQLIDVDLNLPLWILKTKEWGGGHSVLYSSFIFLLSILQLITPEYWKLLLVGLNITIISLIPFAVSKIVYSSSLSKTASGFSAFLVLLAYDMWQFSRYILTDSISLGISTFMLCFYVSRNVSPVKEPVSLKVRLTLLASVIIFIFFRPTNFFLLPWVLVCEVLMIFYRKKLHVNSVSLICFFVGMFCLSILCGAYLLISRDIIPIPPVKRLVEFVWAFYENGVVVDGRIETYHSAPQSFFDVLLLSLDRIFHFFFVVPDLWSRSHKLLFGLFFVPAYFLCAITLVRFFRRKFSNEVNLGIAMCVGYILCNLVPATIFVIDFDWRYRLPAIPALVVLASYSFVKKNAACKGV